MNGNEYDDEFFKRVGLTNEYVGIFATYFYKCDLQQRTSSYKG